MHFIKDGYIHCRYLSSHFAKVEQEAKEIQSLKNDCLELRGFSTS